MFQVSTSTAYSKSVLLMTETIAEALAYLDRVGAMFVEEDTDNPGCYDAIDRSGRVLSIEPKDQK